MKLIEIRNKQPHITLSKKDLFIIRAIIGEIYAGVCVDSIEFETIHGIPKNDILKLKENIYEIYEHLETLE